MQYENHIPCNYCQLLKQSEAYRSDETVIYILYYIIFLDEVMCKVIDWGNAVKF